MKQHEELHSLSQEHHHGLMLAQLIKAGSPEYKGLPKNLEDKKSYTINFFEGNLVTHFQKEEDILFPPSRGKTEEIDKQIDELIERHKKIHLIFNKLDKSNFLQKDLDELGILLEAHIRKEEREFFQLIHEVLSADDLKKLESQLGHTSNKFKI